MAIALPASVSLYLGLLAVVTGLRLVEIGISRRHQRLLVRDGATIVREPALRWMVALHTAVIAGAALEVVLLHRPFVPRLAWPMAAAFLAANGVRWWVIRTLGQHWNVAIVDSTGRGVVDAGPYRWVRHPNYTAVFVEMAALPLIHTAWLTAVLGSAAHAWVLKARIASEDRMLLASRAYAERMGHKPRFLPWPMS